MADGDRGRGHFTAMAEMRLSLDDHERRLLLVERDVIQLTDLVVARKGRAKRNRRPRRTTKGE
jgi:hypothetical protein